MVEALQEIQALDVVDPAGYKALALPDEPTARAVRQLLAQWRSARRSQEERRREEIRRTVERQQELNRIRRLSLVLGGGGRRHQDRVAEAFGAATAKGERGLLTFAVDQGWKLPARRRGRPRSSGLL
jgi:hypothetical protein